MLPGLAAAVRNFSFQASFLNSVALNIIHGILMNFPFSLSRELLPQEPRQPSSQDRAPPTRSFAGLHLAGCRLRGRTESDMTEAA